MTGAPDIALECFGTHRGFFREEKAFRGGTALNALCPKGQGAFFKRRCMMGAKEKATALHECGFNCAQSVLGALGSYTGLDENTAMSLAGGFGGGVSCGEICGAASGAVMALGLVCPFDASDAQSRTKVRKLSAEFNRQFRENFGCIRCIDLKRNGKPCSELIEFAAELAETKIKEIKQEE